MAFQPSLSYLLIYFITILILRLPPLWQSFVLSIVFEMIFGALSPITPPPSNSKLRQNWIYVHKFRHRRLDHHLVIRCRRRVPQRPQWIHGNEFPSPHYDTHQNRRSKKPKDNSFHHCRQLIKTESKFQFSGHSQIRFHEPIPPPTLDNLCGSRDFTRLPKLI